MVIPVEDVRTQQELQALYHLAVELSELRNVDQVLDLALRQCLDLTGSVFGFIGLVQPDGDAMEIAAIHGFHPSSDFFLSHRLIPLRPNVFSEAVLGNRTVRSVDVRLAPNRVGQPKGHPPVSTFLGVPLRLRGRPIGMIGLANRPDPYDEGHERLTETYAAQVTIVIRNAQLYERLLETNEQLEFLVGERTRELEAAGRELEAKAKDLHAALCETVDVQERERLRIAQDLHDGVNQLIIGAMLELENGQRRLELGDHEGAGRSLAEARTVLHQVEGEIRRVVGDLHPPVLSGLGLPSAVRKLADRFESHFGIPCTVDVAGRSRRFPGKIEIGIYRIVQEALQNAGMHAAATEASVSLAFGDDTVTVEIVDDGAGFDVGGDGLDGASHFGLRSMRQRADSIGGSMVIRSEPGRGTAVVVDVSCPIAESRP